MQLENKVVAINVHLCSTRRIKKGDVLLRFSVRRGQGHGKCAYVLSNAAMLKMLIRI